MMKFFKIVFVLLLALVILIGGLGYYFISTFDLNKYKTQISQLVEDQIGRKLTINGDAKLGISLVPTVIVNDVELSNAVWGKNVLMVKVKSLEVKVAILPLLKKQIVIDKVELISPQVFLEVGKDGKANWDFSKPGAKAEPAAPKEQEEKVSPEAKAEHPAAALLAGFAARSVAIRDAYVQYDDDKAGSVNKVNIRAINMSAASMDEKLKADFDVNVDGNDIKGDMTLGSINAFMNDLPYPVALVVNALGIDVKASGTLQNIMKAISYDLDLEVYNPNGNMSAPEATLKTKLKGTTSMVDANISLLEVAKNKITGDVSADISKKVPYVSANLKSDLIDLRTFEQAKKVSWEVFSIISSAQASSMVPNDPVPFDLLLKANAKADLSIKNLIIDEGMQATDVVVKATLNDGNLVVSPLNLNFNKGNIDASVSANARAKQVSVKAVSKDMLIQNLHSEFVVNGSDDFGVLSGGGVDIDINVSTSGDTYRQLVQKLDGQSVIIVNPSKLQTGKLHIIKIPFITQLLETLKIGKAVNKEIDLSCAVVRTDFSNGKALFPKGIAVESSQINLVSDGKVNLVNDNIDFGVQPMAGKITASTLATALTSFAKVKGTIMEPQLTIDEKQALKTAVGMLSTGPVYVGGVALLDSNSAPCYEALKGTKYADRFPAPTGITASGQSAYKDTTQALKDTVKDIKTNSKENLKNLESTAKDLLNSFKKKKD